MLDYIEGISEDLRPHATTEPITDCGLVDHDRRAGGDDLIPYRLREDHLQRGQCPPYRHGTPAGSGERSATQALTWERRMSVSRTSPEPTRDNVLGHAALIGGRRGGLRGPLGDEVES